MQSKVDRATAFIELCRRSPKYFRENLLIDGGHGLAPWKECMTDQQKMDFAAIDPAMEYLCGLTTVKPRWQTHYRQRARGGSKTTDAAVDALWVNVFSPRKISMLCVAEDKDQAKLIREQTEIIVQGNEWLRHFVDIQKHQIVNKRTETTMEIMTGNIPSSYGKTPHFTVADEFTHWTHSELWDSVFSSYAKRADFGGILLVNCNAGLGKNWKWELTQAWQNDPSWYYSAPPGAASWFSKENLEKQKRGLTNAAYRRLWLNEWQDSGGEFVSLEDADACINPERFARTETEVDAWTYIAGVDYAEKIDRTVGVVTHIYEGKIIVDRMDVVDPRVCNGSVPVSWVDNWIREISNRFGGHHGRVVFVVDRHQLVSSIQRLEAEGHEIWPFEFSAGKGNYLLSRNLLQLIQQRLIEWYPGCGQILDDKHQVFEEHKGRNDLSTELSALTVRQLQNSGMWRLDHYPGGHDDRAFALGAACLHIVQNSEVFGDWEITPPMKDGSFRLGHAR